MRPAPQPPAALLFDLDGTLLDTERLIIEADMEAFAAIGHPVTRDYLLQFVGKDAAACAEISARTMPQVDAAALNTAREPAIMARYAQGIPLKPGVAEVLAALPPDIPRAVVTSSEAGSAKRKFGLSPLQGQFQMVITATNVTHRKPAPDPYLLAARRLGVAPARCIAFEDSETGAEAAQTAGCYTVKIPDVVPSEGTFADLLADRIDAAARTLGLI
jgi:HAD superfamily hydrolase (TIGR01509 family)